MHAPGHSINARTVEDLAVQRRYSAMYSHKLYKQDLCHRRVNLHKGRLQ